MTDVAPAKPSLGVGTIIGETFRVWLSNIVPIYLAALLPQIVMTAIVLIFFGANVFLGQTPQAVDPADLTGMFVGNFAVGILGLVAASITTAIVVRIAYDSASGRGVNLGAAVAGAMPHILPIAVLSLAAAIAAGFGALLLVIPGLYLYAMWSVTAPAIVVERVGFGGLGRSAALTREYRWSIMGALILMGIILVLVSLVFTFMTGLVIAALGLFVAVIFQLLVNALLYGPFYVVTVMIYTRLREIKEGIVVEDLARVFD